MGAMLAWLGKPDANIDDLPWSEFLDRFSPVFYLVVLVTIVVILVMYHLTARGKKIASVNDVFATYTPLYWLFMALPGGLVAAVLCLREYPDSFHVGALGFSAKIFFLGVSLIALLSYLAMAFLGFLTPAKFRYRPAAYLHRR